MPQTSTLPKISRWNRVEHNFIPLFDRHPWCWQIQNMALITKILIFFFCRHKAMWIGNAQANIVTAAQCCTRITWQWNVVVTDFEPLIPGQNVTGFQGYHSLASGRNMWCLCTEAILTGMTDGHHIYKFASWKNKMLYVKNNALCGRTGIPQ